VKKTVSEAGFKLLRGGFGNPTTKGSTHMFYDFEDGSIEDAGRRLYLAKDRSKASTPGKYHARPKADRPKDKLASIKAERCDKMKITDIDIAKSIIKSARWSRSKAAAEGRVSKRREDRWFVCENCSGKAKIYHVTSLTEAEYSAKFEASKRGEYTLAA
jgi:hypothetical protein